MGSSEARSIAEKAADLLALADADPPEALIQAEVLVDQARGMGDPLGEAQALRALGLAARNNGDIDRSVEAMRRGVVLAESAGDITIAAQVRTTLGPTLLYAGRPNEAVQVLAAAAEVLTGVDRAKVEMQLGGIKARMARFDEALTLLESAVTAFEKADEQEWLAHASSNLGLVDVYAGDYHRAEARIRRAQEIYERIGHASSVGIMTHNLGFVAMRAGRIGEALHLYRQAERQLAGLDQDLGELLTDHCEALMLAGLYADAVEIARRAVAQLQADHMEVGHAEAELMLSHAAFLAGDLEVARAAAATASASFDEQDRPGWAAHAEFSHLRASHALGEMVDIDHAVAVADRLEKARQHLAALAARVIAGRIALESGDLVTARAQLGAAAAAKRSRRLDLRVNAWTAEAMLRRAEGDGRGTSTAIRAGIRSLEDLGATLGSTDARLGVHALGAELMQLALDVNIERGAGPASEWIERIALRNLDFRPVAPNPVPEVEAALSRLRLASADLRSSTLDENPVSSLQAEVNRQVAEIRHTQLARGDLGDSAAVVRRARAHLGEAVMVQWAASGSQLHGVVTDTRRRRTVVCGPVPELREQYNWLRFHLLRLARYGADARRVGAVMENVRRSSREMAGALLEPLRLGDRPLVLVPPRWMLGIPWGLLPGTHSRPVSVAPSVRTWLQATFAPVRHAPVLAVAGPDLPGAEGELATLLGTLDRTSVIRGRNATAANTRSALEKAGLAHIIAHGSVAADNPMLSALQMVDGPLMLYDLEDMATPPHTVVLSACDSGRVATGGLAGVGIATALLGVGVSSVIASCTVIPDTDATAAFFSRFYGELMASTTAEALARASGRLGDDPESLLLRGFVAFGSG